MRPCLRSTVLHPLRRPATLVCFFWSHVLLSRFVCLFLPYAALDLGGGGGGFLNPRIDLLPNSGLISSSPTFCFEATPIFVYRFHGGDDGNGRGLSCFRSILLLAFLICSGGRSVVDLFLPAYEARVLQWWVRGLLRWFSW